MDGIASPATSGVIVASPVPSGSGPRTTKGARARPVASSSRVKPTKPEAPLPHPAEDLSADDDLLSWILVDQLGCMPNSKLGVHPQENKFVGPVFKTEDVLNIVKNTAVKGNIPVGMAKLQEFYLIKHHLDSKRTESQRDRFIQHLRRYLLCYAPTSRIDIHTTSRYSHVTKHPELAVYATRPLSVGTVLTELQGSVVPLPEQWRIEMDLGDEFSSRQAAEDETDEGGSDDESEAEDAQEAGGGRLVEHGEGIEEEEEVVAAEIEVARRRLHKGKEVDRGQGQRRSDRTRRRDFSIVWSGLKRCYQLFLGPARFLNHDCSPKVELLRQGRYVTFRVIRPVRIGDELTTYYGDNYFGKNNAECLCLTCEQNAVGHFAPKPDLSRSRSRSRAASVSNVSEMSYASTRRTRSQSRASSVRNPASPERTHSDAGSDVDMDDVESEATMDAPSHLGNGIRANAAHRSPSPPLFPEDDFGTRALKLPDDDETDIPVDDASVMAVELENNEATVNAVVEDEDGSEADSDGSDESEPKQRERLSRTAKTNALSKPWNFLKRLPTHSNADTPSETPLEDEDLPETFPRCGSCVRPLHERIWYSNRYFDHCTRCTRHAFIFGLPWPAHKPSEVQEYPPAHLIPPGYLPRPVSTIPLPSLQKKLVKETPVPAAPARSGVVSKIIRRQLYFRKEIAMEEYVLQSLREAAWAIQAAEEEAIAAAQAAAAAKVEARRAEREEKKRRDAEKLKGSGVWSRYEYISEEEVKRREAARFAVTSGTRRGRQFRKVDEDGDEGDTEGAPNRVSAPNQVVSSNQGGAGSSSKPAQVPSLVTAGASKPSLSVSSAKPGPSLSPMKKPRKPRPSELAKRVERAAKKAEALAAKEALNISTASSLAPTQSGSRHVRQQSVSSGKQKSSKASKGIPTGAVSKSHRKVEKARSSVAASSVKMKQSSKQAANHSRKVVPESTPAPSPPRKRQSVDASLSKIKKFGVPMTKSDNVKAVSATFRGAGGKGKQTVSASSDEDEEESSDESFLPSDGDEQLGGRRSGRLVQHTPRRLSGRVSGPRRYIDNSPSPLPPPSPSYQSGHSSRASLPPPKASNAITKRQRVFESTSVSPKKAAKRPRHTEPIPATAINMAKTVSGGSGSSDPSVKRKRGRPPGTGHLQRAAARAAELEAERAREAMRSSQSGSASNPANQLRGSSLSASAHSPKVHAIKLVVSPNKSIHYPVSTWIPASSASVNPGPSFSHRFQDTAESSFRPGAASASDSPDSASEVISRSTINTSADQTDSLDVVEASTSATAHSPFSKAGKSPVLGGVNRDAGKSVLPDRIDSRQLLWNRPLSLPILKRNRELS